MAYPNHPDHVTHVCNVHMLFMRSETAFLEHIFAYSNTSWSRYTDLVRKAEAYLSNVESLARTDVGRTELYEARALAWHDAKVEWCEKHSEYHIDDAGNVKLK